MTKTEPTLKTVNLPYPDTDYPTGHPSRCWGTVTIPARHAESWIKSDIALTSEEKRFILRVLQAEA